MTDGRLPTSAQHGSGGGGPVEEHRSDIGRAGAVAWYVLAALLAVDVLRRGHGRSAAIALLVLAAISLSAHALAWRPAVLVDDSAATLVNPLRTVRVPWSAVTSVGGSWSLEVRTSRGTYTAWASGPRPRPRRSRSRAAAAPEDVRLSARLTGRWEDYAARHPHTDPQLDAEPVATSWDRVVLVAGSLLALAALALLVTA